MTQPNFSWPDALRHLLDHANLVLRQGDRAAASDDMAQAAELLFLQAKKEIGLEEKKRLVNVTFSKRKYHEGWAALHLRLHSHFSFSLMIHQLFSSTRRFLWLAVSAVMLIGYVYYSQPLLRPVATRPVPQELDTAVNEVCQDAPGKLPEPLRALKPMLLLPLEDRITCAAQGGQEDQYNPGDVVERCSLLDGNRNDPGDGKKNRA